MKRKLERPQGTCFGGTMLTDGAGAVAMSNAEKIFDQVVIQACHLTDSRDVGSFGRTGRAQTLSSDPRNDLPRPELRASLESNPVSIMGSNGTASLMIGNNILNEFETRHDWAFGAFAELIQNASDAKAKCLKIGYKESKNAVPAMLVFDDDGSGMSGEGLKYCFMLGENRPERSEDDTIAGQYGVGFKQGVLRLGHTALVISRTESESSICFGVLSNKPYKQDKKPPICAFTSLDLDGMDTGKGFPSQTSKAFVTAQLKAVVDFDGIQDFISFHLGKRTGAKPGTSIYIFGVGESAEEFRNTQVLEVRSHCEPPDICLMTEDGEPYKRSDSVAKWQNVDIPLESSLREYCKFLFYKPRMKIELLGKEVECISLVTELEDSMQLTFRPGKESEPILGTVGRHAWHTKRKLSGAFFYTANCLIRSYDYSGNKLFDPEDSHSPGALILLDLSKRNLKVASNKQYYVPQAKYPYLLRDVSKSLHQFAWSDHKVTATEVSQSGWLVESWILCARCQKWRCCTAEYAASNAAIRWYCDMLDSVRKRASKFGFARACDVPDDYEKLQKNCFQEVLLVDDEVKAPSEKMPIDGDRNDRTQTKMSSNGTLVYSKNDFSYDAGVCLGEGSFAKVYRGKVTKTKALVAVKIFKDSIPQDLFNATFHKELQAVEHILNRSENVVRYFGFCMECKAIIMELVNDCRTLRCLIDDEGVKRSRIDMLGVMRQICCGMAEVHSCGVLHKDIKPENVLCSEDLSVIKVTDFGISSLISSAGTTGPLKHHQSLRYSSPEQERGDDLTIATDVWSFGLILVEVCTDDGSEGLWKKDGRKFEAKQISKAKLNYCDQMEKGGEAVDQHLIRMLPCISIMFKDSKIKNIVDIVTAALHPKPSKRLTFADCKERLDAAVMSFGFAELHGQTSLYHILEPGDYLYLRNRRPALTRRAYEQKHADVDLRKHILCGSNKYFCSSFVSCSLSFKYCLHYFQRQNAKDKFPGLMLEIDINKLSEDVKIIDVSSRIRADEILGANWCRAQNYAVCAEEVVLDLGRKVRNERNRVENKVPADAIIQIYDFSKISSGRNTRELSAALAYLECKCEKSFKEWSDQARKDRNHGLSKSETWDKIKDAARVQISSIDELMKKVDGIYDTYWKSALANKRARPIAGQHEEGQSLPKRFAAESIKPSKSAGSAKH